MSLKGKGEPVDTASSGNRLIDSLPSGQRNGVLAQCERVELASGTVLCDVGKRLKYAYFPIAGSISLMSGFPGHRPLETGRVGREGMLGAVLILNVDQAIQRGVVQIPCLALRMKATTMGEVIQNHPALLHTLQRYLSFLLSELTQAAGCMHFHEVVKRLARVLLLAHDQNRAGSLHLTHQCLAEMLGVRRGAVTIAASHLQREGIIGYRRGRVSILDRVRLEASSCECYTESVRNYANIHSWSSAPGP
ncbi:Crp/Fnr family transcriptional regulator [Marinimicrobium agarilyticum]|uniref:Crp/Fnr family transcriptional regulator n=1 Tax=Marinimicrobium agarilyticum TaxID=306546 RepID=UPI000688937D|nr:Crp/Fnr family transcriptional regulator [Marinimicrobium agarilyticum]